MLNVKSIMNLFLYFVKFFSRPNREFDKPMIFLAPYCRIGDDATMDLGFLDPSRKTPATGVEIPRDCRFPN